MSKLLFALAFFYQSPEDATLPRFEVATVKPIDTRVRNNRTAEISPGGRIRITSMRLPELAGAAWMMPYYYVVGPDNINMFGFSVEAQPPQDDFGALPKVPAPLTFGVSFPEISMLRLRALLIERFKLKYHIEKRERLTYDLVLGKKGTNATKVPLSEYTIQCTPNRIESGGRTMAELADRLGRFYFLTSVEDKTGLTDTYAFSFSFENPLRPSAEASENPLPTLVSAVQDIGLKLVPQKRMMPVLVIDHWEQPSEN